MREPDSGSIVPLAIGLAHTDASWISLLDSEGIARADVGPRSERPSCPLYVVPHRAGNRARRLCIDHARNGAAVIMEQAGPALGVRQGALSFPYHPDDFAGLRDHGQSSGVAVEWGSIGKGVYYRLPFRLDTLWSCTRTGTKHVVIRDDPVELASHEHAWVVKKNVRRTIVDVLRRAFWQQELPFVHTWYWPGGNRSVFCLRGDLDGGPADNLLAFLDSARGFEHCVSLFVSGRAYTEKTDLIRTVNDAGIEVGNHCFSHYVFPDRCTNRRDILLGESVLAQAGIDPKGLVYPAHFWHQSHYREITARGYGYFGAFGLDQDNLPYYPVVKGRLGQVVHIPYSCIGDFVAKFAIDLCGQDGRRLFRTLMAKQYLAGAPVSVYGHPDTVGRIGESPDLVRGVFEEAAARSDVWMCQLFELAAWWQRRAQADWKPCFDVTTRRLVCHPGSRPASLPDPPMVSIQLSDGSWRLADADTCARGGIPLDQAPEQTPLQWPGVTEPGEIVHVDDDKAPLIDTLRLCRWRWERAVKKYAEVYSHARRAKEGAC